MFRRLAAASIAVALFAAACSSNGGASQGVGGATQAPASTPATQASQAASGGTVMLANAGGQMVLVAGSNGMTLYTFSNDAANSGKSACSGGCAQTWPPLTVGSGATPTAGSGVTGKLGTITRDDGSIQVTYKGLPLYFFHGDSKPGDTNGHYTNWNLVTQ